MIVLRDVCDCGDGPSRGWRQYPGGGMRIHRRRIICNLCYWLEKETT